MRKAQKQEVIEFINSLYQAHEEIKDALERENFNLVQNMLGECQEFAVALGESIERFEGKDHVTISYIEEYCEFLFYVYNDISNNNMNQNKISKMLKKQLIKIDNSVKNDIIVKKEIAFFPYKASMWDSLESVYLAAAADPTCDAYCVPIPYYTLNPDHSSNKMYYEGREYPKNIKVIDWQHYNFEERKPDEIYIHNPYDYTNLVTSVHPRFYSENLKKYTEKLLYIPYFILDEAELEDQNIVDKIKHFIWVPGVINADKVIVQSERMKQIYVNGYLKLAKENGLTGKHIDKSYLEQKFLGLGSPKIDKVFNTKRERLNISEDWLRIIQKPDGKNKKIIFYNTGIGALLQYNEKWIDKIKDVLKIFKENRNEVALLWRPHPLIENTMKSMRPGILQKYLEIKNAYLNEDWGIFDDTVDLSRAVALSDAYYGDRSSVVQLFQQTGKTVMIQNMEVISDDINRIAPVRAITKAEGEYWFTLLCDTGLYKMKLNRKRIEKVLDFKEGVFSRIAYIGGKLYCIPNNLRNVFVYDIQQDQSKELVFASGTEMKTNASLFQTYVIDEHYLYLIPYAFHSIVRIDTLTDSISEIRLRVNTIDERITWGDAVIIKDKLFIPMRDAGKIVEYNLTLGALNKIDVNKSYTSVFCINQALWLIPLNAYESIDVMNIFNYTIEEQIRIPREFIVGSDGKYAFSRGLVFEGKLYLLSWRLGKNIVIDIESREIKEWKLPVSYSDQEEIRWLADLKMTNVFEDDGTAYVTCGLTGEWIYFHNGEWKVIEQKYYYDLGWNIKHKVIDENKQFDLTSLFMTQDTLKEMPVCDKNCGKYIYETA